MPKVSIRRNMAMALLGWTVIVGASFGWNTYETIRQEERLALREARALFNKDKAFRFWGASHGGVYVPKTERTPPNPFLAHLPERDIATPSGKELTLMNPAYMLRTMMEEYQHLYGAKGHITSTVHFRPETAPDEWERKALARFERGEQEVVETAELDGKPYLRLMQPLFVKESCLKCHGFQGYEEGDLRGGVSLSVPLEPYYAAHKSNLAKLLYSHLLFWAIGVIAIFWMMQRIRRHAHALKRINNELEKRVAEEVAKRMEKEEILLRQSKMAAMGEMIGSIAHQWRQPLNVISLQAQEIGEILEFENGDKKLLLEVRGQILKNVDFMDKTIDDFRSFFKPNKEKSFFQACEIAGEIYHLLEVQFRNRGIAFLLDEHQHFTVLGYPNEFKQVMLNLFNNARDAFERGDVREKQIRLLIENDGKTGTIRMRDNAGGIQEELLPERLFHSDVTTKGHAGTGIGLWMSKIIIEEHMGGSLSARNVDGGAELIIRLPLAEAPGEERNI